MKCSPPGLGHCAARRSSEARREVHCLLRIARPAARRPGTCWSAAAASKCGASPAFSRAPSILATETFTKILAHSFRLWLLHAALGGEDPCNVLRGPLSRMPAASDNGAVAAPARRFSQHNSNRPARRRCDTKCPPDLIAYYQLLASWAWQPAAARQPPASSRRRKHGSSWW